MTPRFLFAGHQTVGNHVARCLTQLGWEPATDASQADVAFTYFTSASALEDAYFDGEGLVKRSRPGTLLVDLSPTSPSFARELSAVATVNDLRPIEAPLSVLDPAVADAFESPANLMCHVAGDPEDVDEAIDVLETIAGQVERTGASGTAQLAKAARTVQAAALLASVVESEALVRATVSATTSLDAIDVAAQPNTPQAAPLLAAVVTDSFEGTYTIEMFMAEVVAAMSAADDVELILPQLESVMHLLEVIAVIGGAEKAPAALSLMYREEADSAAHGLDWTRAEQLFADHDHGHDHCCDHDHDFDDDDDFGMYGGFGGYSAN